MPARRVTPMVMVSDVAATVAEYEQHGFKTIATGESDCVGLVADATGTGLIVLGAGYASRSMPAAAVAELQRGAGLYIWVDRLADVMAAGAELGEMDTAYGTRERYVREASCLVAYAERLAG
jgi:hypothetical protein